MKIRELLQTELWSKSTTWKFLFISIALVVVVFVGWFTYERYWISLGVRDSGRKALTQIDEMQTLGRTCSADFEIRAQTANRAIEVADQKASTVRDFDVLFQLTNYLASTRAVYLRTCKANTIEQRYVQLKKFDDRLISSAAVLKQELHSELD